MPLHTPSSPHFHGPATVTSVMVTVMYALIPGIAVYAWLFGWGVVVNLALALVTAVITEAVMLKLRQKPLTMYLSDGSVVVTALLLGLALPPLTPWWIPVLGAAFAVVFAKHIYGGLGYNPFNPAMVGYVMLLISFPKELTAWAVPAAQHALGLGDTLGVVFFSQLPAAVSLDALTAATPLDYLKTQLGLEQRVGEVMAAAPERFGLLGGQSWEWINLAFLAGGLWLMYKRIITWHVPVGVLGGLAAMSLIFFMIDPSRYPSPLFHVLSGGAILGAFFIATDPVSGATTLRGRLLFGVGVGVLTFIIRTWGGYPDAIAFAVLLMNMAAPTIDYYTQPRVFGHGKE